jgi:hypothetical protein
MTDSSFKFVNPFANDSTTPSTPSDSNPFGSGKNVTCLFFNVVCVRRCVDIDVPTRHLFQRSVFNRQKYVHVLYYVTCRFSQCIVVITGTRTRSDRPTRTRANEMNNAHAWADGENIKQRCEPDCEPYNSYANYSSVCPVHFHQIHSGFRHVKNEHEHATMFNDRSTCIKSSVRVRVRVCSETELKQSTIEWRVCFIVFLCI